MVQFYNGTRVVRLMELYTHVMQYRYWWNCWSRYIYIYIVNIPWNSQSVVRYSRYNWGMVGVPTDGRHGRRWRLEWVYWTIAMSLIRQPDTALQREAHRINYTVRALDLFRQTQTRPYIVKMWNWSARALEICWRSVLIWRWRKHGCMQKTDLSGSSFFVSLVRPLCICYSHGSFYRQPYVRIMLYLYIASAFFL